MLMCLLLCVPTTTISIHENCLLPVLSHNQWLNRQRVKSRRLRHSISGREKKDFFFGRK